MPVGLAAAAIVVLVSAMPRAATAKRLVTPLGRRALLASSQAPPPVTALVSSGSVAAQLAPATIAPRPRSRRARRRPVAAGLLTAAAVVGSGSGGNVAHGSATPGAGSLAPHWQEAVEFFKGLDVKQDGRITVEQYIRATHEKSRLLCTRKASSASSRWLSTMQGMDTSILLEKVREQWLKKLFHKADLDGDGHLSEAECEFLYYMLRANLNQAGPAFGMGTDQFGVGRIDRIFKLVDVNGDGHIDRNEFRQALLAMGRPGLEDWGMEFEEEISQWLDAVFDKVDVKRDGTLSPDEFLFAMLIFNDVRIEGRWQVAANNGDDGAAAQSRAQR